MSAAEAQVPPGAPPSSSYGGGSPLAGARAEVTLRGSILYDTNVARSSAAVAALRGIVQEDETYSPTVVLNLQKALGRLSATLQGSIGYDFYQHNTILNRESINLEAGLNAKISSCTASLNGDYARQQSDLQFLTLVTTKNTQTSTSASLNTQCGRRVGFAPYFSVSQAWSDNSASQLFSSDSNTLSGSAGVAYRRPALGSISLFWQFDRTKYPNRLLPVGLNLFTDGYDTITEGLRLDHTFAAVIDTSLVVSNTSLHSHVPTGTNFKGLTYEADVGYHPTTKFDVRFVYYRRINPSNRIGATYSLDQSYSLSADYKLNRLFLFSVGGSSSTSNYQGLALIPGIDVSRQSSRSVFGTLTYDIGRNFSLLFNATHQEATANVVGFSYTDNQLGLSLSKAF